MPTSFFYTTKSEACLSCKRLVIGHVNDHHLGCIYGRCLEPLLQRSSAEIDRSSYYYRFMNQPSRRVVNHRPLVDCLKPITVEQDNSVNEIDQHDPEKCLGDEPFLWFGGSIFKDLCQLQAGQDQQVPMFTLLRYIIIPTGTNKCRAPTPQFTGTNPRVFKRVQQAGIIQQHLESLAIPGIYINMYVYIWLVVSTPLKKISQNGNLPQIGVKINNI